MNAISMQVDVQTTIEVFDMDRSQGLEQLAVGRVHGGKVWIDPDTFSDAVTVVVHIPRSIDQRADISLQRKHFGGRRLGCRPCKISRQLGETYTRTEIRIFYRTAKAVAHQPSGRCIDHAQKFVHLACAQVLGIPKEVRDVIDQLRAME